MDLCEAFIDLSKAIDTVNRELFWEIMRHAGCPIKFTNVVSAFHNQMTATVSIAGDETVPFGVEVVVKQRCVMKPVICNVFLAAALYLFKECFPSEQGVLLTCRLDGSVFNLIRMKA